MYLLKPSFRFSLMVAFTIILLVSTQCNKKTSQQVQYNNSITGINYTGNNEIMKSIVAQLAEYRSVWVDNIGTTDHALYLNADSAKVVGSLQQQYPHLKLIIPLLSQKEGKALYGYLIANLTTDNKVYTFKLFTLGDPANAEIESMFTKSGYTIQHSIQFNSVRKVLKQNSDSKTGLVIKLQDDRYTRYGQPSASSTINALQKNVVKPDVSDPTDLCTDVITGNYYYEYYMIGTCRGQANSDIIESFITNLSLNLAPTISVTSQSDGVHVTGPYSDMPSTSTLMSLAISALSYTNSSCVTTVDPGNLSVSNGCTLDPPPGGGGSGSGGSGSNDSFDDAPPTNNNKPTEYPDKCTGLAAIWNNYPNNEVFGFLTIDNQFIQTAVIAMLGGATSSIWVQEIGGVTQYYYYYDMSKGAPANTYQGIVNNGTYYFIPIKGTVHTHSEARNDGTDGISGFDLSADDASLAQKYPALTHWVIGNNAVGTFSTQSNQYNLVQDGPITSTCNAVQ